MTSIKYNIIISLFVFSKICVWLKINLSVFGNNYIHFKHYNNGVKFSDFVM